MNNPPGPRLGEPVHVCDGLHCIAGQVVGDAQDGRRIINAWDGPMPTPVAVRHTATPQIQVGKSAENTYHAIGECPWHR